MTNTNNTNDSTVNKLVDLQAERAVLGSCLIDPDAVGKVTAVLDEADFYRQAHQIVFSAMKRLAGNGTPLDIVTLAATLTDAGALEDAGGQAGLIDLYADIPTAMWAEHYAGIVAQLATRRRLMAAGGKIAEIAYDGEGGDKELIDQAESVLFKVGGKNSLGELKPVRIPLNATLDRIGYLAANRDRLMGVPTGFAMLDRMLGGFQKSDLIIMAGRPGVGKTSFALSIAQTAVLKYKVNVAVFSLEMSDDQLMQRLLSMTTGVDSHRLRMGRVDDSEWPILMEAANELSASGMFIDDTPAASVTEIRTKARRLHAEHGLDMILIDYMQLMSGLKDTRSENRTQEVSYISRSLKALARELDVPVVALSQLSRAVEQRADKRPMLSDLRESGSIEQDSDVVLFIYRDDYYDDDSDRKNIAEIIVAKHRHGATGTVNLFFRKELTQFRDLEVERVELS